MTLADEIQAGVASERFDLPTLIPLAGYSQRRGRPSRGVHDPVGARALVVADGRTTLALVSADLLIVDESLAAAVQRRLAAEGMPADLVLLLAGTHTHSGPGGYGRRFLEKISMGHFDPRVVDALVEAISRAIVRAYAGRVAVEIASAEGAIEGLVQNRLLPDGPVEAQLVVVGCYRIGARDPFAVLVNFAAHPTTLGPWNRYVSGDYPGVVMRELQRRLPGATAMFFAADVGDQAPVKAGIGFERAEWIGIRLADRAEALLAEAHPMPPQALQASGERMALPPARIRLGGLRLPRWMGQSLVDDDATLVVARVGEVAVLGVPCDLTADLGRRLKAAARERRLQPMVIGFANDYIGYCVSEALYTERAYESSMAFNGPRAGELVVDHLIQLLDRAVSSQ